MQTQFVLCFTFVLFSTLNLSYLFCHLSNQLLLTHELVLNFLLLFLTFIISYLPNFSLIICRIFYSFNFFFSITSSFTYLTFDHNYQKIGKLIEYFYRKKKKKIAKSRKIKLKIFYQNTNVRSRFS